MTSNRSSAPHYHFVTGRLAADALREVVHEIAKIRGFSYTIEVMPITVAALITTRWLLRHLHVPAHATKVILPGYCDVGLEELQAQIAVPVQCGPKDLRDLPQFFGEKNFSQNDFGQYSIEILAEINHAPRLSTDQLLTTAKALIAQGADIIDLGCDPASPWNTVADAVHRLRDLGIRVSIDSFDAVEVEAACRAGAELVLSVNRSNRNGALDWGTEVVAIPDAPHDLESLEETINFLQKSSVPFRVDPILEPIGVGLAASIVRYAEIRRRYPDIPMMMGVGNLSELTDVDSAGINVMLLGICEELSVHSVLTTQVINWARTSVRECDVARRLAAYAVRHRIPPKHLDNSLIRLRDPQLKSFSLATLETLAKALRDHNVRIYAQDGAIYFLVDGLMLSHEDPFALFEELLERLPAGQIDSGHAFYLGFEAAKALTALTLGKHYEQDEALNWGDLTRPEDHHRVQRRKHS